ncbi:MAG: membrane protein insertase YidC [Candidatus Delongbacteria bacterium]|nr:membrane protein insertase YidC [Candidatus Delongbacteria bacterium]
MDKKSGIGLIIIVIIILLTPFYQQFITRFISPNQSPPPPAVTESPAVTPDSLTDSSRTITVSGIDDSTAVTAQSAMIGDTTSAIRYDSLENKDIKLIFSSRGGVIHRLYLKKYFSNADPKNRPPVQLIPPTSLRVLNHILFIRNHQVDLSQVNFQMQPEENGISAVGVVTLPDSTLIQIRKHYSFNSKAYTLDYHYQIQSSLGLDKHLVEWDGPLNSTESNLEGDLNHFKVYARMGDIVSEENAADDKELKLIERSGQTHWVGLKNKYFLAAMISPQNADGIILKGQKTSDQSKYLYSALVFRDSAAISNTLQIYIGPIDYQILKSHRNMLEKTVDMGNIVIKPFSYGITYLIILLNRFIYDWGILIIVFSLVIKLITYPLTFKSYMASKRMAELQPKMNAIREQYGNDPQKMNKATMELYKKEKINPMGGCLPMLLQLPIFFGLYRVFDSTIMLRDQDFLWIRNLADKDSTMILPILMTVLTVFQNMLTIKDPKQKFMVYLMPVVMFFIFKNLSSGLVLYWTCFTLFTIIQQEYINRFYHPAKPVEGGATATTPTAPRPRIKSPKK